MHDKRKHSQAKTHDRNKRQSIDESFESEDDELQTSSQFIRQKEDVIKDAVIYLLSHNSSLLPVKKNDLFGKFGEKLGRKEKIALLKAVETRLLTVGACLKKVDLNRFILVNKFPRSLICDEATPEKQLLCFILALIIFGRGSIKKTELETYLSRLGIDVATTHPYFGNVSKSLQLYEKQYYLKKLTVAPNNTVFYEWGIRASCEVDKDSISSYTGQILGLNSSTVNSEQYQNVLNLSHFVPPEDHLPNVEND